MREKKWTTIKIIYIIKFQPLSQSSVLKLNASRLGRIIRRGNFLVSTSNQFFFSLLFFFMKGWQSIVLLRLLLWSIVCVWSRHGVLFLLFMTLLFCIRDFFFILLFTSIRTVREFFFHQRYCHQLIPTLKWYMDKKRRRW